MKFLENVIVDESDTQEEAEIIRFGFKMMQTAVIGIAISIVIGIAMGKPWQGLLLILVMLPLRQNAGGLHLKTRLRCTILSVIIFVTALFVMSHMILSPLIQILVHLISAFILIRFSPVDNQTNRLDDIEKEVYGDRAKKILGVESMVFFALMLLGLTEWSCVILFGIFLCAMLVILGQIQNELSLG